MYGPMYGIQLAFKNFKPLIGISGSPWVGFVHFKNFFNSFYFSRIIKNTLGLNLYFMIIGFPVPIILALLLNEVRIKSFKKIVQTITYFPHFISVVVLASMITTFVNSEYGIINQISSVFGVPPVNYLQEEQWFKTIHVFSTIWQSSGWNAIVYISVLSTVDSQLLEAASIDGASRLQRVWYINVPAVIPTAILMFILNTGRMMTVGFEKVFLLQNPLNMNTSDVISTYVYRIGIQGGQYGTATAVGLFNSVINLILILLVNKIASTLSESSLW
jgi:putative aldouronate transport system permease protein